MYGQSLYMFNNEVIHRIFILFWLKCPPFIKGFYDIVVF